MKNIVFISSSSFNPDPRAFKQMNTLIKNGYKVFGIGWDRTNGAKEVHLNSEIKILTLGIKSGFGEGMKNLLKLCIFQVYLASMLIKERKNIDIVHAVNLDSCLTAFLFSKLFNKKIVYDIYDYYVDSFPVPNKFKKIVKWIDTKLINNVDCIILPIESRINQISPANPKKVVYVYNTPKDISTSLSEYNKKDEKLIISYVGILQEHRFISELIDIIDGDPDIVLNIAGFGQENIINKIKESNNCFFYGKVDHETGLKLSFTSDLMLCVYNPDIPNHKYSAPNKFYEAMMLSKPLLTCEGMGIDKIVEDYKTGIIISYTDHDNLLEKLHVLNNSKKELRNMGVRARSLYDKKFNWKISEKSLLKVYSELSNKKY